MVQFAGGTTVAQLRSTLVEEGVVPVRLAGAVGTALHGGVTGVDALACLEAAEVPSTSTASTM